MSFQDFVAFAQHYGKMAGDTDFESKYDLNGNEIVDFPDFILFAKGYGR